MSLPDRPDIARLRRLARALQRACRAGEASALSRVAGILGSGPYTNVLLAHAQYVVAREHGHSSWPRMKSAVEARNATVAMKRSKALAKAKRASEQAGLIANEAAALCSVAKAGDPVAVASCRPLGRRIALRVRDAIAASPPQWSRLVDVLIVGLMHSSPRVRYECAHLLDTYDDGRAAAALAPLIDDPVPRVRRMAIDALVCDACKFAPSPWNADICRRIAECALEDESVQARRHAVWTLPKCGPELMLATCREVLLRESDSIVRRAAEKGLERQGVRGAVPLA